jgi:hypothetical protein
MRIIIVGLMLGSTLGLVAATAASRYGSPPVTAVSEQRTQVILPDDVRKWDI